MTSAPAVRRSTWTTLALVVGCVLLAAVWWMGRSASQAPATAPASAPARAPASAAATAPATAPASGLPTIAESALPRQARDTLALIRSGGPFPYRQDGGTFQNRERQLPRRATGYYREYTVETPGSPDRGPRRIIAGRDGDLFWTADHYDHFQQILEGR